jgi:DNA-binding MarR family transcriptional regulator
VETVRGLDDVEMRAWRSLIGAFKGLWDVLDLELRTEHDLSLADYEVLLFLEAAPDQRLRMAELAEQLHLSPSGLTRRLDGMVRAGLVARERCPSDRRIQFAVLTRQGTKRLQAAAPTHVRGVRQHFVDLLERGQLVQLAEALEGVKASCGPAGTACDVAADAVATASRDRRGRVGAER